MKDKYNLLEREKATQALHDGFAITCGEKHREFLTKTGEEIIELGIRNGTDWMKKLVLKLDRISIWFEMKQEGLVDSMKIDGIIDGLKVFFTDEQIEVLKVKDHNKPSTHEFVKGLDKYEDLIVKTIKEKDMTCKNPVPFFYFKNFGLSAEKQFKSVTLYGEGGLGLDQYAPGDMKYMKSENELFYCIEAICRKYHYLGMLLAKQQELLYWIDILNRKMKPEMSYAVKQLMCSIIYELALDSVADEIIMDIQKETGVLEGFMTHKQIDQSLRDFGKSKEGKKRLKEIEEEIKKK